MLTACATLNNPPTIRHLPQKPDFVKPVVITEPKQGEDVLIIAARERAARLKANRVIAQFSGWYDALRDDYAAGQPERQANGL